MPGYLEPDPAHKALLEALLGRYDPLPLECDGFTRVASYCLKANGVRHAVCGGSVLVPPVGMIDPHWWLMSGGWVVDYRLRMWAGPEAPHGVFLHGAGGYRHDGGEIAMPHVNEATYAILAGGIPAVPAGAGTGPHSAGPAAAPSGADPAALAVPRRLAWQVMGARGPGRWTRDHLTFDGQAMLCGKRKPSTGEIFRDDVITGEDCPKCRTALAKLRAGATGRAVRRG